MSKLETLKPVTEQELLEASETVINIENHNIGIIDNYGLFCHILAMTGGGKYLYSHQGEPVCGNFFTSSIINSDEYDYEEVDE